MKSQEMRNHSWGARSARRLWALNKAVNYVWPITRARRRESLLTMLLYPNLGFAGRPVAIEFSAQIRLGRVILGVQHDAIEITR